MGGGAGKWPGELHAADRLTTGNIEGVVARLICSPYWEGLEQQLMNGAGQLELTSHGVLVVPAGANVLANPSFGHATYNTGWTAEAGLQAINETRAGFYRSHKSSVRLSNPTAGTLKYTQSLTLAALVYTVSCFVIREDGAAVTSADCVVYGQGAAQTTTFTAVDGGPWYLAWGSFTGAASVSTHGIQVKAGKQIYVDDFQIENRNATILFPTPFCSGAKIGSLWSGTVHNSSSTRVAGFLKMTMADEFTSQFTFSGWFTPHWTSAQGTGTLTFVKYILSTTDEIRLDYLLATNTFQMTNIVNSVSVADSSGTTRTVAYKDRIHIAIVKDETNLRLYVNGVLDASLAVASAAMQNAGGIFSLGADSVGGNPSFTAIDAPVIWKQAFTAAQVLSLYTAEVEIKTPSGGIIGQAPYFWCKDGDGVLDAVNDTNRDHFGVVGGVSGDVEALTEWRIQPPTSTPPRVYWLARKATDENFDAGLLYLEFQGTAAANQSGAEYEEQTSASAVTYTKQIASDSRVLQGHYQAIVRLFVSTNNVTTLAKYGWGIATGETTSLHNGKTLTIATNASSLIQDYGDLMITFDEKRRPPLLLDFYIVATPVTGTSTTRVDFIQLLPWPHCRVTSIGASVTIATGDLIHISGEEAYIRQNSTGSQLYTMEYRGQAVDVVPNKYNTIYFIPGEDGAAYDVTDTGTFTVLITPRFTLPGGLVA